MAKLGENNAKALVDELIWRPRPGWSEILCNEGLQERIRELFKGLEVDPEREVSKFDYTDDYKISFGMGFWGEYELLIRRIINNTRFEETLPKLSLRKKIKRWIGIKASSRPEISVFDADYLIDDIRKKPSLMRIIKNSPAEYSMLLRLTMYENPPEKTPYRRKPILLVGVGREMPLADRSEIRYWEDSKMTYRKY